MDQIKIGKFISSQRKRLGLTQRELAEKLLISDKTVSKWECGGGLPEVSLMIPLCEILNVNVNELLSGEKLDEKNYNEKAEENMMDLMSEREERKKKTILAVLVEVAMLLSSMTLFYIASLPQTPLRERIALIVIGLIVFGACFGVICILEYEGSIFQCRRCGEFFVPKWSAYMVAPHSLTTRRLRCPHCGKKSYCRRRIGKS